ncbi:MAG TPA: ATP-binding protein [Pseudomonadales bacterium]|nr:ATP-binding protein [Pseudomonadales bacterium]
MTAPARNTIHYLQQLQILRALVWLAQALSLLLAHRWLSLLQLYTLSGLLLLQLLVLAISHGRLLRAYDRLVPPGETEFFLQLLADCLVLSAVLYVAGGATNPFVTYYLVPIALSAATLPRYFTALLTVICLASYSGLLFFYLPLQVLSPHEHHHGGGLGWHVVGMWINFGVSALLITHFVAAMAATVRSQRDRINALREQQLVDENIMAVATLAAGTAHELGTPLSSLAVVLGDLQHEHHDNPALCDELQLMAGQVARCQQSLRQLADTAREHQSGARRRLPVEVFVQQLIRNWQVLRPEARAIFGVVPGPALEAVLPLTVEQALINLLDNAANASRDLLKVSVQWDNRQLDIVIEDDGQGVSEHILQQLGQQQASDKGMGLGLLLSHASLERAGGSLLLERRAGGGTTTRIHLPLEVAT